MLAFSIKALRGDAQSPADNLFVLRGDTSQTGEATRTETSRQIDGNSQTDTETNSHAAQRLAIGLDSRHVDCLRTDASSTGSIRCLAVSLNYFPVYESIHDPMIIHPRYIGDTHCGTVIPISVHARYAASLAADRL